MLAALVKAAVLCVAVSVHWPAGCAAFTLPGCYLDLPADGRASAAARLAGRKYTADHGSTRYSVCVCCNVTARDANVSVEAAPVAGGRRPAVFGRRNCSHLAGTDGWLLLQYHGGDNYTGGEACAHGVPGNRSTALVVLCDAQESLSVVQADNCSATLELRTPLTCVPGLSHGSVFCILFGAIAGTYLLVGVVYRRLVCGAKGIDQLPNKEFWLNLGDLQADRAPATESLQLLIDRDIATEDGTLIDYVDDFADLNEFVLFTLTLSTTELIKPEETNDGCNLVCRRGEPLEGRGLSRHDGWQQIAGGSFTDSDRDDAPLQP